MKRKVSKVWMGMLAAGLVALNAGAGVRSTVYSFDAAADEAAAQIQHMLWLQTASVELNELSFVTNWAFDLSPTNLVCTWQIVSATNVQQTWVVNTGVLVNATSGWVRFTLTPEEANLATGNYIGFATAYQASNGTNYAIAPLARQSIRVLFHPDSRFGTTHGPMSYDFGGGNATSWLGRVLATIAPENGQAYAWDAATTNWVPTTISGTGGSATNATLLDGINGGAHLVGESNISVVVDGTNIRVRTTGVATGTPVYAETDSAALNSGTLASNSLQSQVNAKLASNTWLTADSTTNYVRRTGGNIYGNILHTGDYTLTGDLIAHSAAFSGSLEVGGSEPVTNISVSGSSSNDSEVMTSKAVHAAIAAGAGSGITTVVPTNAAAGVATISGGTLAIGTNIPAAGAESDPVWMAAKAGYATGTPLYAYTETDPVWVAAKAGYATGTPLYAYTETDPQWSAVSGAVYSAIAARAPIITNPVEGCMGWYHAGSWLVNTNLIWDGTNWTFYWKSTNSPGHPPMDGE